MAYRTTRRADRDIIDIYVHGARLFGDEQAERYAAGLLDAFALLAENPRLARERAEFRPSVRLYRYRAHMIVYVEQDRGEILIVRVLHGRQDWEQHLL